MEEFQFTKRVHNILKIAAEEEKVISFNQFIYLLACKEGTGVCSELYMYLFRNVGTDF